VRERNAGDAAGGSEEKNKLGLAMGRPGVQQNGF